MTSKARRWCFAALVGCSLVVAAARELMSPMPSLFARSVLAPVSIVVSLIPTHNIGTAEKPLHEGTPLHLLAGLAVLPVCAIVYTVVTYALLAFGGRLFHGAP